MSVGDLAKASRCLMWSVSEPGPGRAPQGLCAVVLKLGGAGMQRTPRQDPSMQCQEQLGGPGSGESLEQDARLWSRVLHF